MAPRLSFSVFAIALLLVGTSAFAKQEQINSISFGYVGTTGPGHWGNLNPNYTTCSHGKWQSPVNIVRDKVVRNKQLKPLTRDYAAANSTLVDNGFNIAIRFEGHVGVLVADGKNFTFKQMHWHSPSEHQIDGKRSDPQGSGWPGSARNSIRTLDNYRFPVEMHLVHQADDGSFAVVSALYHYGDPDPFISKIKSKMDELAKEEREGHEEAQIPLGVMKTKYLSRKTRKYYRYFGSLTTPPCTEKIMWNILGKVKSVSKDQVKALKAPLVSSCKNNSRPVQPLNGRHIEVYHDELRSN